jgi:hypothetical protein
MALFLYVLTEKLTPRERSDLVAATAMPKEIVERWHKLETRSNRLARDLEGASKPSKVYAALSGVPGERALFLLLSPTGRTVHERIRNYFSRYLPTAREVTTAEIAAAVKAEPGSPKFERKRAELIAKRLDARPRRVAPDAVETEV